MSVFFSTQLQSPSLWLGGKVKQTKTVRIIAQKKWNANSWLNERKSKQTAWFCNKKTTLFLRRGHCCLLSILFSCRKWRRNYNRIVWFLRPVPCIMTTMYFFRSPEFIFNCATFLPFNFTRATSSASIFMWSNTLICETDTQQSKWFKKTVEFRHNWYRD